MRLLLDTNAFFWAVTSPSRLSAPARAAVATSAAEVMVSALSAWEISYKVRQGRFPQAGHVVARMHEILERMRVSSLPLKLEHGIHAGRLDWPHRDPFDRMIVAQAILEGATLVTSDRAILDYPGVRTLW